MRPPRLEGFSYVGLRQYFLTICTHERLRHFTSETLVRDVYAQFLRTGRENGIAILAYCFMPDHVHLLVEAARDDADLEAFVATAKQRAAYIARQWIRGRLWQPGYFDRILREEDDVFAVARYVLNNPVRAGLVDAPEEYPFLGSEVLTTNDLIGSCAWSFTRRCGGP